MRRVPGGLQPDHGVLGVAEHLRAAAHVAVLLEARGLRAEVDPIRDRHVDHGADVAVIEVAARELQVAVELVAGLPREHADRTAGAVAPEERALGAAQHLDALHVQHPHHGTGRARHEHVVDVEPHAALARGAAAPADASNLIVRRRVARAARALDVQIRRGSGELEHVAHALVFQGLAGEGDHGDGRVLQRHLAPLRGDDDFLEILRARRRPCGDARGERSEHADGARWLMTASDLDGPRQGVAHVRLPLRSAQLSVASGWQTYNSQHRTATRRKRERCSDTPSLAPGRSAERGDDRRRSPTQSSVASAASAHSCATVR